MLWGSGLRPDKSSRIGTVYVFPYLLSDRVSKQDRPPSDGTQFFCSRTLPKDKLSRIGARQQTGWLLSPEVNGVAVGRTYVWSWLSASRISRLSRPCHRS